MPCWATHWVALKALILRGAVKALRRFSMPLPGGNKSDEEALLAVMILPLSLSSA
jgi:hypothetical protein